MSNKKAAIVTIYGEFNYGNRLQNFAVARVLESMGYSADTLAVLKRRSMKRCLVDTCKNALSVVLPKLVLKRHPHIVRERSFKRFTRKHIPTRRLSKIEGDQSREYDMFFVGSDQVFNPCFGGYENIFDLMLLTFVQSEKKRCISPSFGVSELPDEWKEPFRRALSDFPRLNAREADGARVMKELTGRDALVTIDPTLMLDAEEWLRVAEPIRSLPKHYVLDYFLGKAPFEDSVYNECEKGRARIKLLDKSNPEIYVSGPGEFITLVSQADLVCTDSFHACVFSILFSKPFVVYARNDANKDMISRIDTLLAMFGIDVKESLGKVIRVDDKLRDEVLITKRAELLASIK